jgi:hypothetical protein
MSRKKTKKKWIVAAALIVTATLIPAEASSPNLPDPEPGQLPTKLKCAQKSMGDSATTPPPAWGTCDAGSNDCCYGRAEAKCEPNTYGGFEAM